MAIRNSKLGGSNFVDGEVLYDYDLDDTNNAIIDSNAILAEIGYKSQQATGWTNGGSIVTEKFTTPSGLQSTVDTNIIDDISADTTYLPAGWANPNDAFDTSDSTLASYALFDNYTLITTLGKTFASRFVKYIKVKCSFNLTIPSTSTSYIRLYVNYGAGFVLYQTLFSNSSILTGSTDVLLNFNNTITGLYITIGTFGNSSVTNHSHHINSLLYGDITSTGEFVTNYYKCAGGVGAYTNSTVISSLNTTDINSSTNAFCVHAESDIPAGTNIDAVISNPSDGTFITLPIDSVTGKSNVIAKGLVGNTDNLTLTFNLNTTDVNLTPKLYGWGLIKL